MGAGRSAYNGHFATVVLPPAVSVQRPGRLPGGLAAARQRAERRRRDDLLVPEMDRQQAAGRRVAFRADAAFARPAIYEGLERTRRGLRIRMPANKNLELAVEDILFRRPGPPSCKPWYGTRVSATRRMSAPR